MAGEPEHRHAHRLSDAVDRAFDLLRRATDRHAQAVDLYDKTYDQRLAEVAQDNPEWGPVKVREAVKRERWTDTDIGRAHRMLRRAERLKMRVEGRYFRYKRAYFDGSRGY